MVIGNPNWFTRRKYGGWGLHPKTWQGWVYIAVIILPLIIFHSIPIWNNQTRITVTIVWLLLLIIDVVDIMIRMKKDEREKLHEAIAERNAMWFVTLVIALGIVYYTTINAINQKLYFEPFMTTALIGGLIIKAISNYMLDKKN